MQEVDETNKYHCLFSAVIFFCLFVFVFFVGGDLQGVEKNKKHCLSFSRLKF